MAPTVKLTAIYTIFDMVPQFIDIFQARTGDANDNGALSIVYSHFTLVHVTHNITMTS